MANVRSAYAEVVASYLSDGKAVSKEVTKVQTKESWEGTTGDSLIAGVKVSTVDAGGAGKVSVSIDANGDVTLGNATIKAGNVTAPANGG